MTPSSFSRISQRLLTRQTCIIRLSNGLVGDGLVTSCDAFGSLVVQPDLPQYPNILRNSACKMGEQYIHKPKKEIFGFLKTWYLTARVLCFLRTWDLTARGWSNWLHSTTMPTWTCLMLEWFDFVSGFKLCWGAWLARPKKWQSTNSTWHGC